VSADLQAALVAAARRAAATAGIPCVDAATPADWDGPDGPL